MAVTCRFATDSLDSAVGGSSRHGQLRATGSPSPLGPQLVPLNFDPTWTDLSVSFVNTSAWSSTFGFTEAAGVAVGLPSFTLPTGVPGLAGVALHHAAVLFDLALVSTHVTEPAGSLLRQGPGPVGQRATPRVRDGVLPHPVLPRFTKPLEQALHADRRRCRNSRDPGAWRADHVAAVGDQELLKLLEPEMGRILTQLPDGTAYHPFSSGAGVTIACQRPTSAFASDDERRAWLAKTINTFVHVLRPRAKRLPGTLRSQQASAPAGVSRLAELLCRHEGRAILIDVLASSVAATSPHICDAGLRLARRRLRRCMRSPCVLDLSRAHRCGRGDGRRVFRVTFCRAPLLALRELLLPLTLLVLFSAALFLGLRGSVRHVCLG